MIALYAAFYLLIKSSWAYGTSLQAIPYSDLAQCEKAAGQVNSSKVFAASAFCIEGNKP